jgi:hypothetical protein
MGYLWLIWDFGLAHDEIIYKSQRINDYFRIIDFFDISLNLSNEKIINIVKNILLYQNNYQFYFGNSDKKFFNECILKNNILLKLNDLSKSYKIINKKPYIINDF